METKSLSCYLIAVGVKSRLYLISRIPADHNNSSLDQLGLQTLSERRQQLCKKFATKCLNNDKSKDMFPLDNAKNGDKFKVNFARHSRLLNSAIPQMQKLMNQT